MASGSEADDQEEEREGGLSVAAVLQAVVRLQGPRQSQQELRQRLAEDLLGGLGGKEFQTHCP